MLSHCQYRHLPHFLPTPLPSEGRSLHLTAKAVPIPRGWMGLYHPPRAAMSTAVNLHVRIRKPGTVMGCAVLLPSRRTTVGRHPQIPPSHLQSSPSSSARPLVYLGTPHAACHLPVVSYPQRLSVHRVPRGPFLPPESYAAVSVPLRLASSVSTSELARSP